MQTGRRKAAIYASIIVAGLAAGLALRASGDGPQATQPLSLTYGDRVAAMVQLFEAFCIGALNGKPLDPAISLFPASADEGTVWQEPGTDLSVMLDLDPPATCTVSDDLRLLSPSEKQRLARMVEERVAIWAPVLSEIEPAANDHFLLKAWTSTEEDPEKRWGLILTQFAESGPNSFSILSLGLPSD